MTDFNTGKPEGSLWVEPESDFRGEYPYNKVTSSDSGHFMEMDDTPGHERLRVQHRTGTFTEIQANGQRITKIFGKDYHIVIEDNNVMVGGNVNLTVMGDVNMDVSGNIYQLVKGDVVQSVDGNIKAHVKENVEISAEGDMDIVARSMNLVANDGLNIFGDLFVTGNINTTNSVNVAKNLNAGQKVSANWGFDTIAGLNCGFATPGPNGPGVINALTSVSSPLGSFVWMTDIINVNLHNWHVHPTKTGLSGPPIPKMI